MKTYRLSRAEEILFRQKATHITALPNGRDIVDVVIGKPGPTSDKKIFDERQSAFDPQQKFQGDKAYQGGKSITTPQKKPRHKELSPEDKLRNKALACKRIVVEHLIRSLKIFRVAQERFRLSPDKYEQIIRTICGLVRLRLRMIVL
jgi:hypothetical protein